MGLVRDQKVKPLIWRTGNQGPDPSFELLNVWLMQGFSPTSIKSQIKFPTGGNKSTEIMQTLMENNPNRKRGRPVKQLTVESIREMLNNGYSRKQIAHNFGVSKN
ncbi:MAG: hypothetical protein IPK68_04115 [Bdellovibrionales bacterium]|nr:hypothetical protein [Bdellovibrionales bacterium]